MEYSPVPLPHSYPSSEARPSAGRHPLTHPSVSIRSSGTQVSLHHLLVSPHRCGNLRAFSLSHSEQAVKPPTRAIRLYCYRKDFSLSDSGEPVNRRTLHSSGLLHQGELPCYQTREALSTPCLSRFPAQPEEEPTGEGCRQLVSSGIQCRGFRRACQPGLPYPALPPADRCGSHLPVVCIMGTESRQAPNRNPLNHDPAGLSRGLTPMAIRSGCATLYAHA